MFVLLDNVVLREIRWYQKSTEPLICKLLFQRIVSEIAYSNKVVDTGTPKHWKPEAIRVLQKVAEEFLLA